MLACVFYRGNPERSLNHQLSVTTTMLATRVGLGASLRQGLQTSQSGELQVLCLTTFD
jgi:hypothetical protein